MIRTKNIDFDLKTEPEFLIGYFLQQKNH